jgi:hypothetical protein
MTASRQAGVVLAVSLIMLTLLTLLAVTAIDTGTTNLRVVGNMQAQMELEAGTQAAVETYLGSPAPFAADTCDPPARTGWPGPEFSRGLADMAIDLEEPICLDTRTEEGTSELAPLAFEDTLWEIRATGRDAVTGAVATIRQGIAIKLPHGHCPRVATNLPCSRGDER